MTDKRSIPSLLDRSATGGQNAQRGFLFQDNFVMANLPRWLANDGFMHLTQEAIGDVEVEFYLPNQSPVIEYAQVKNHDVELPEFREIIGKCFELFQSGNFRHFSIVCPGVSNSIKPLIAAQKQIQNLVALYDGTEIEGQSIADFTERARSLALPDSEIAFLTKFVIISDDYSPAQEHGDALFRQALSVHFKEYEELPAGIITQALGRLRHLIHTQKSSLISRSQLETAMFGPKGSGVPPRRPLCVQVIHDSQDKMHDETIQLNWSDFWGGEQRKFPEAPEWDRVIQDLRNLKQWMAEHRSTNTVKLMGKLRISQAIAFGSVFSAVSHLNVEMEHSEAVWRTNDHANSSTPDYPLEIRFREAKADSIVVSVGIIHDIQSEVEAGCELLGLGELPMLHIRGSSAIESAQHANRAVTLIKSEINQAVRHVGASQIHLFYAGPTHVALFLGHRLNSTANTIQCYERPSVGVYMPTCRLFG